MAPLPAPVAQQGLLADGQCFTPGQLRRCLRQQDPNFELDAVIPAPLRVISAEKRAKKPSETLFRAAAQAAAARGIIHKNQASNRKSRLVRRINALTAADSSES